MKLVRILLEFLGSLYRDIVVTCSSDYVEYTLKGGCFTYKNILPFNIWRNLRSKYIDCADYLVSECDLYQDILKNCHQKTRYNIRSIQ